MALKPILLWAAGTVMAAPAFGTSLTNAQLSAVVARVAQHQIAWAGWAEPGDYRPVSTRAEFERRRPAQGLHWVYAWGVTLYGVQRAADALGNPPPLRRWVDRHNQVAADDYAWLAANGARFASDPEWQRFAADRNRCSLSGLLQLGSLDNCGAMGTEFLEAARSAATPISSAERSVQQRIAGWVVRGQARLPDGTLWRPAMRDEDRAWPDGTIWADDLYMAAPFLVRWARVSQHPELLHDAARQILNQAARLQDADGLWWHAYSVPLRHASPIKWGRANGWAAVATAEVLTALPDDHPDRAAVLAVFRRHIAGLLRVQAPDGCWRQILDRGDAWEETSCTAMFSYAIARGVGRGWLPASDLAAAERGFASVAEHSVTPDGRVLGTCAGTGISLQARYYLERPRPEDDLHGRGPVLLAGAELMRARAAKP